MYDEDITEVGVVKYNCANMITFDKSKLYNIVYNSSKKFNATSKQ